MKYLKESCYHRIEWLTATSQRLQEGVDGININTNNLIYMWRVKMKGRGEYKIEGRP